MRSETFHVLDYHEFETLVNEHLKPALEYDVVLDQEWNNDESHAFSIAPDEYTPDDRSEVQAFLRGEVQDFVLGEENAWVSPANLLSELALRDIIPWGHYLIEVCW